MRWSSAVVLAVALGLAIPAGAMAETRYVTKAGGADASSCTNPGAPCLTVSYAVGQAASGDTIQIGPGEFVESVSTDKALTFVGAGAGSIGAEPAATVIRAPFVDKASGLPALDLQGGGTVRSLRAQGAQGGNETLTNGHIGGDGIVYRSLTSNPTTLRLQDAVLIGGNGGGGKENMAGPAGRGIYVKSEPGGVAVAATGSELTGGSGLGQGGAIWLDGPAASFDLVDSRIPQGALYGTAIVIFSGGQMTLDSVEAQADNSVLTIYDGSLAIRRSRLSAEGGVLYASGTSSTESPEVEIVDSLLVSEQAEALILESEGESTVAAKVFGSTLIGHGLAAVTAEREEGSGPATLTLRNSIVRHLSPAPKIIPAVDLHAEGGTIQADFSSFTTRLEENGGSVTAPGTASNISGDPAFIDEQNGVYVLQNTSPLIDRGDPGIVAAGQLDLGGSPRLLDGNRDCLAVPDLGAFEVTGQSVACPPGDDPKPTVSGFGMTNRVFAPAGGAAGGNGRLALSAARKVKRGTRFTYNLSEPARVTITVERKGVGRKARAKCVKATRANRKAPRCVRFVKATSLTAQEQAGRGSMPFSGRVRGKRLKPGRYRARIVAIDSAGQASEPQAVGFRIVRG